MSCDVGPVHATGDRSIDACDPAEANAPTRRFSHAPDRSEISAAAADPFEHGLLYQLVVGDDRNAVAGWRRWLGDALDSLSLNRRIIHQLVSTNPNDKQDLAELGAFVVGATTTSRVAPVTSVSRAAAMEAMRKMDRLMAGSVALLLTDAMRRYIFSEHGPTKLSTPEIAHDRRVYETRYPSDDKSEPFQSAPDGYASSKPLPEGTPTTLTTPIQEILTSSDFVIRSTPVDPERDRELAVAVIELIQGGEKLDAAIAAATEKDPDADIEQALIRAGRELAEIVTAYQEARYEALDGRRILQTELIAESLNFANSELGYAIAGVAPSSLLEILRWRNESAFSERSFVQELSDQSWGSFETTPDLKIFGQVGSIIATVQDTGFTTAGSFDLRKEFPTIDRSLGNADLVLPSDEEEAVIEAIRYALDAWSGTRPDEPLTVLDVRLDVDRGSSVLVHVDGVAVTFQLPLIGPGMWIYELYGRQHEAATPGNFLDTIPGLIPIEAPRNEITAISGTLRQERFPGTVEAKWHSSPVWDLDNPAPAAINRVREESVIRRAVLQIFTMYK